MSLSRLAQMPFAWLRYLIIALCLAFSQLAIAEVAVPPLTARVTDLTNTLTLQQQAALSRTLAAFEAQKGSQIAVLIVPTTQPETIEQYGIKVVDQWQLGRKGIADGVLLLIAKDDRKMRLEVGRGLEGVLPDVSAKRIISETIQPYFKQGEFYTGIQAGIDQTIRVIDGESLPPPKKRANANDNDLVIGGIIAALFISSVISSFLGRAAGGLISGGLGGIVAWFFTASLFTAGGIALLIFILTLVIVNRGGIVSSGYGGWHSGSSGWGGSSGGFSGGGGDFGGGGASGDW